MAAAGQVTDQGRAGPLDEVRVVEIAGVVLGPLAGQMLGDLGADVIKIEPPYGDSNRRIGPARGCDDLSAFFIGCNRNKRSVVLDLKSTRGAAAARRLISGADVLLHNFRPGAIERLGLSYNALRQLNPGLVYCACYGFGAGGVYAGQGAFDDSIQAVSGLADLQERVLGQAGFIPTLVADKTTAMYAVQAILAALYHRERTGEGQAIEVPMFESVTAWLMVEHLWGQTFEPPMGDTGYPRVTARDRRPYRCRDGKYLAVLPYQDEHWRAFCTAAGRQDLVEDPRFCNLNVRAQNIEETYRVTSRIIAMKDSDEWLELLQGTPVPFTPVRSMDSLVGDPHLDSVEFWRFVEHPEAGMLRMPRYPANLAATPASIRRPPPRRGAHSLAVLRELGIDECELQAMLDAGETAEPGT